MIPAKYLEYLKTAPIDKVDFVATFIEVSQVINRFVGYFPASKLTFVIRCLRGNIRPWVVDRHFILESLKLS